MTKKYISVLNVSLVEEASIEISKKLSFRWNKTK